MSNKPRNKRTTPIHDRDIEISVLGEGATGTRRKVAHSALYGKRSLSKRAGEEHYRLRERVQKESDRVAVLLFNSFLEEYTRQVLVEAFRPGEPADDLLSPLGALGAFVARVRLLEALGLVTASESALMRLLAKIRNDFAHTWTLESLSEVSIKGFNGGRDAYLDLVDQATVALGRASFRVRRAADPADGPVAIPPEDFEPFAPLRKPSQERT
ncbi:MAG: hypothetical protein LCH84_18105 [Gemmatimonadetes bacterium]|nr:hypothetical protein [Gemmatimonadota bacterium]